MPVDIEDFRTRLQKELKETGEAIQEATRSAGVVELDQPSVGRISRIDALQQQALSKGLLERLNVRMRKLEAAMARLHAGSYGLCCACQSDMEPERLHADPAVVFCRECSQEREKNDFR